MHHLDSDLSDCLAPKAVFHRGDRDQSTSFPSRVGVEDTE